MSDSQLDDQIIKYLEDAVDCDRDRINALLLHDAAARRALIELSQMTLLLRESTTWSRPASADVAELPAGSVTRAWWTTPRRIAAMAAALLIAATVAFVMLRSPANTPTRPMMDSPASVALLSDLSADAKFASISAPALGSDLGAGPIALTSGHAQLMFRNGAVVDLTGPCEFHLTGPNGGYLDHGKLEAHVSKRARGFTVDSPNVSVTDLGTHFQMITHPSGRTRVRVVEGRVRVDARLPDRPAVRNLTLAGGQQVIVDPVNPNIAVGSFPLRRLDLSVASVRACNATGTPNSPTGDEADHAVDDDFVSVYANLNTAEPGLEIYPDAGASIVNSLTLTASDNAPQRDPRQFTLDGSNDGGATWTEITHGPIPAFPTRSATHTITFANHKVYGNYRLRFAAIADAHADRMQIADVELGASQLLPDATAPGDMIAAFNASGEVRSNEPVEGVAHAIDNNPDAKYLNFNKDGAGMTVELDRPRTVIGVGLRTANDSAERDPAAFTLAGSNDGKHFTEIVRDQPVRPISDRHFQRNFIVANTTAYRVYRLSFSHVADPGKANSMQVGEVELFAVPSPLHQNVQKDARDASKPER